MSKDDGNIEWIALHLMPKLVQSGKFTLTTDENLSGTDIMKIKSYDIQSLSAKDAFMLTLCYKVKVYLTDDIDGSKEHCIALVITPNIDEQLYDTFNYDTLFKNEIIAYEELFPALGWSDRYPKYYYSHIRTDGVRRAAIALGDFTHDGWSMSKHLTNLPLDHIMIAVREIGQFHGAFYALKHAHRPKFDDLKNRFEESRYRHSSTSFEWDTLLKTGPKRAIDSVRRTPPTPPIPTSFLCKLATLLADPFNYQRRTVMPKEPMAILCHGDYLRNNIAFYYSGETRGQTDSDDGPTPLKAMIFDFQTLRYSSPMVDLATFMFNSSGRSVRTEYFRDIFKMYHDQVIQNFCAATTVQSDYVPDYLSYDRFLREYAIHMPFGLSVAASFLPVLHEPQEFDMAQPQRTFDEITCEGYERGGAIVDAELRALVVDMYNLYQELNLDLTLADGGTDEAVWEPAEQHAKQQAEMPNVTITT